MAGLVRSFRAQRKPASERLGGQASLADPLAPVVVLLALTAVAISMKWGLWIVLGSAAGYSLSGST